MKYSLLKIRNGVFFSLTLLLSSGFIHANFPLKFANIFSTSKKHISAFFDTKNTEPASKHIQHLEQSLASFTHLKEEVDHQELPTSAKNLIKGMLAETQATFAQFCQTVKNNQSSYLKLGGALSTLGSTSAIMKKAQQDLERLSAILREQGMNTDELDVIVREIAQDNQGGDKSVSAILAALKHRLSCK
jgi:hypothetical protein